MATRITDTATIEALLPNAAEHWEHDAVGSIHLLLDTPDYPAIVVMQTKSGRVMAAGYDKKPAAKKAYSAAANQMYLLSVRQVLTEAHQR